MGNPLDPFFQRRLLDSIHAVTTILNSHEKSGVANGSMLFVRNRFPLRLSSIGAKRIITRGVGNVKWIGGIL